MKNDAMQRCARSVKLSSIIICVTVLVAWLPVGGRAQVNSGSNGSDGAFNPTTNTNIDMADHPNGIYQYTSVNIPTNVTVTFTPNANNTPVVWLVQSNVVINGTVDVSGQSVNGAQCCLMQSGAGGPGGYSGGNGANGNLPATSGRGPGGGPAGQAGGWATASAGPGTYCNSFLVPLLGGSGGGGYVAAGAGGGGAILIGASGFITINGGVLANGGNGVLNVSWSGGGSGGSIRLIAMQLSGHGNVSAACGTVPLSQALGRVRFDTYDNEFGGSVEGQFSSGFQPIIIPSAGQLPQLTVTSVGGVPVSASPTGVLSTPDAVLSAQQNNPIPVVISCANLPLNTPITVSVKPANGSPVSATGYNTTGTLASSTATVSISMPRGGGLIYATAATSH
jgi:hypothetical protein